MVNVRHEHSIVPTNFLLFSEDGVELCTGLAGLA